MSDTKQVICVRRDLNMSPGKMAAQVAHASMSFLTKDMVHSGHGANGWALEIVYHKHYLPMKEKYDAIMDWMQNSFTKIVVYLENEEELEEIRLRAEYHGLLNYTITDNGKTEFDGVPTKTCIAIGPDYNDRFKGVTDHLPTK